MEFQYHGANCVHITTKSASFTVDDNLDDLGLKSVTKTDDISILTDNPTVDGVKARLVLNQPGEYEVSNTMVTGIATRSYTDEDGKLSSTIFKIEAEDVSILVVGHIYPELTDKQLEKIGTIDVLFIPVGDKDSGLSGDDAIKLTKKIEPKIVIPTHYADSKLKYQKPQATLDEALKEMAMEPTEVVPKLKIKAANLADSDSIKLIVLERT